MIIKKISKTVRLSKNGKPYASVSIQLDEYRDGKGNMRFISGFGNRLTWAWKVGDDVVPEITQSQDGRYLNFSFGDGDENRLNVHNLPASVGFVLDLLKPKTAEAKPMAQGEAESYEEFGGGQEDKDDPNNPF